MRSYAKPQIAAMSQYLIIAAAIFAVCNSTPDDFTGRITNEANRSNSGSVDVQVYYESLCWDSIQFIKNQLLPTSKTLGNYMTITFVPYGKASHQRITDKNGNEKWYFTCQHGASECYGNKAQACAIDDILTNPERPNKQSDQVDFVGCVMAARNPANAVPECLERIGIDAHHRSLVNECITSSKGDDLLVAQGEKTFDVQPTITFVPTIVINGVYNYKNQENALQNLKGLICSYISTQYKPATCTR